MLCSGLKCVILLQYLKNPHLIYHPGKLILLQSMREMPGAEESVFFQYRYLLS